MTTSAARVRMSPDDRRGQLLEHGVRLLSTRSLDELSIDLLAEEAGVSRGLLYHYFGNKQDFHLEVVRRAVADLVEQTAPPAEGDPLTRLEAGVAAYVDYVVANYEGYTSLVKSAAGGNEALREVYDEARSALTDRIFEDPEAEQLVPDTPVARMLVRAWSAMVEDLVIDWVRDPRGVSREEVVGLCVGALPSLVALCP